MTTETLLKWAGVVLVVLAAIFFVGTAISRGWISPEVQLAGATVVGLALITGGFRLVDRNRPWAAALVSGGAVIVQVCAAAANGGLDLIAEYPALVVLAVVTVGVGWVSHRLKMESVAIVSGLAAVFLPLWIIEDADLPALVPAGWMAVLALAATGFGWFRGWVYSRLATVGASGFVLLTLAIDADPLSDGEQVVALIAAVFVALAGWAGPAYPSSTGLAMSARQQVLDHRLVLSVPLWTWGVVGQVAELDGDRAWARLGFALAAAFIVIAGASWRQLPRTLGAAHLLGAGVLVAISFASVVDGPGLLVALAVQAAATGVIALFFKDRWLGAFAALLGAIAVAWAARSTAIGLFEEQSIGQLLANLLVLVIIIGSAGYSWFRSDEQLTVPLIVVSWVGVLGWTASAFGHQDQGQVVVSLIWSALAAAALVLGVRSDLRLSWLLGISTLVVVLFKLLTVDLAEVDTLWRVGLFLVVGAGLLRLGYVLPRLSRVGESQLR